MGDDTLTFSIDTSKEDKPDIFLSGNFNPERTAMAAESVSCGFDWSMTKEGFDFWSYVNNRLVEISKIKVVMVKKEKGKKEIELVIDGVDYIARLVKNK